MAEQIKNRYKENKKRVNIILFFTSMLIMLGLFIYFGTKDWQTDANPIPDNIHFINDYPNIGKNNVFVYKKSTDIQNILKSGTGVVFFCTPKSEWCKKYAEILNETAKDNQISEIYYYDIYPDRLKQNQTYKDILSIVGDYALTDDEGNKKLYLPAVFAVKNGHIIAYNYDTAITIGAQNATNYWTIDKIIETKIKLTALYDGFKEIGEV